MYSKEYKVPFDNVSIEVNGLKVKVKGPKGELEKEFKTFYNIKLEVLDKKVRVSAEKDKKKVKAIVGSIIAHIRNMVIGVTKGYYCKLKAVYMHFPVKIEVKENKVFVKNFLGERSPRIAEITGNVKVSVNGDIITVEGIDKDAVMQTALNIEQTCRIVGYDRRVFLDGIYITEKGELSS